MAHLRRLIRLLAVMLLTAISLPSVAGSYPSSCGYSAGDQKLYSSLDEACRGQWAVSEYNNGTYRYKGVGPKQPYSGWTCQAWYDASESDYFGFSTAYETCKCLNGGTLSDDRKTCMKYCPEGQEFQPDGTCKPKTCPEGQELQPDGTCKPKENTCKYADNEQIPGVYSMPSSFSGVGGVCLSGCRGYFVPYREGASSDGRLYGRVFSYGEPCTAGGNEVPSSAPNEDPRTKCIEKGMHYGESNGVIVCVPKGNSGGGNNGGGNGNQGGNGGNQGGGNNGNQGGDSGGGNGGGSGGGGGGNGSGNGSGDGNGSGNGSGGGGGGSGGGGKGGGGKDEGKENEYCKNNPDALACLKSGTPTEEEGLPRKEIGIKGINPFSLGGPGTCPANIELPHGAYVTFETVCQYARAIRPFLLLFAWISAFYIVFPTRGRD